MHNIFQKYAQDINLIPNWAITTINVPTLINNSTLQPISQIEWILEDDSKENTVAIYYRYLDVFDSDTLIIHPYYYRIDRIDNINNKYKYRYIRSTWLS